MTDYDYVIEADEEGTFNLPEKYNGEDAVIRQKGSTTTHQGRTMRWEASSQNDHLEVNEEENYFEVEASIFGSDKTGLIKVETPEQFFEEETEVTV